MSSINFKSNVKTYDINGDKNKTISVNTTDYAILDRIKKSLKNIEKMSEAYKDKTVTDIDVANEIFVSADSRIRAEINYIFDADVCTTVFGNTNCFSLCDDGSLLFENFINAIVPVVRTDMLEAQEKSKKNIEKYTSKSKKYIK